MLSPVKTHVTGSLPLSRARIGWKDSATWLDWLCSPAGEASAGKLRNTSRRKSFWFIASQSSRNANARILPVASNQTHVATMHVRSDRGVQNLIFDVHSHQLAPRREDTPEDGSWAACADRNAVDLGARRYAVRRSGKPGFIGIDHIVHLQVLLQILKSEPWSQFPHHFQTNAREDISARR